MDKTMKKWFLPLLFSIFSGYTQAFDSSWIEENVHDGCTFMESKAFVTNRMEWNGEPNAYGVAIGATNALLDSDHNSPDGWQYNVSYYSCPTECFKSGASEENGMIGKENVLNLIGYKPIECIANLIVPELLRIDFDNDGFMGYAIRYKTVHGGFQGSQGHLTWGVAFIKNSNGKLSKLSLENANLGDGVTDSFYHKLTTDKNTLSIQHYIIKTSEGYEIVSKNYLFNGTTLVPAS